MIELMQFQQTIALHVRDVYRCHTNESYLRMFACWHLRDASKAEVEVKDMACSKKPFECSGIRPFLK